MEGSNENDRVAMNGQGSNEKDRVAMKRTLKEEDGRACTECIWLTSSGLLCAASYRLAEVLLVSHAGLRSMELGLPTFQSTAVASTPAPRVVKVRPAQCLSQYIPQACLSILHYSKFLSAVSDKDRNYIYDFKDHKKPNRMT